MTARPDAHVDHDDDQDGESGRTLSTLIGFYMWRGGLIFCACYGFYLGAEQAIRVALEVGVPVQVIVGVSFLVVGFLILVASLIVERVIDARAEGSLLDG